MNHLQFVALWINCKSMSTSDSTRATRRIRKIVPALCLLVASLATFVFAAYPIYVIRPFTEQAPAALKRALWVLLYDKPVSLILASLLTALAFFLWRRSGWIARTLLVPAIGITILAAVSTWINPYEQMFHPLGEPKYVAANLAAIDPADMVIAVTLGKESRAYPIREMGYHHVVNDRLHQLPIVVTY
jgi:Protein of unknown function (DUF3179)